MIAFQDLRHSTVKDYNVYQIDMRHMIVSRSKRLVSLSDKEFNQ